jgi:hypothetical protein
MAAMQWLTCTSSDVCVWVPAVLDFQLITQGQVLCVWSPACKWMADLLPLLVLVTSCINDPGYASVFVSQHQAGALVLIPLLMSLKECTIECKNPAFTLRHWLVDYNAKLCSLVAGTVQAHSAHIVAVGAAGVGRLLMRFSQASTISHVVAVRQSANHTQAWVRLVPYNKRHHRTGHQRTTLSYVWLMKTLQNLRLHDGHPRFIEPDTSRMHRFSICSYCIHGCSAILSCQGIHSLIHAAHQAHCMFTAT